MLRRATTIRPGRTDEVEVGQGLDRARGFKQRRDGLDGENILIYKFRSMTVWDDGVTIVQAKNNDARITRLSAFFRKSSLDELPQFINVLPGE